jgi:hypothetical protein
MRIETTGMLGNRTKLEVRCGFDLCYYTASSHVDRLDRDMPVSSALILSYCISSFPAFLVSSPMPIKSHHHTSMACYYIS